MDRAYGFQLSRSSKYIRFRASVLLLRLLSLHVVDASSVEQATLHDH